MDKENRTAGELLQEKLCINRRNIGLTATDGEEAAAQAFCEPYKQFLDACKTEREAVTYIVARAQAAGYKPFDPKEVYLPGDRVYYNNRGQGGHPFNDRHPPDVRRGAHHGQPHRFPPPRPQAQPAL